MIETLAAIWRRLLKQPSIGINDNFFDLGGNPAQAVELFSEISRAYGRQLPPVMIYQAPTIRELAYLLTDSSSPRECPALVLMKPGNVGTPIFLAPGMGGDALQLFHLVKHLNVGAPVYVLQAHGIDGLSEPLDCIEEMADRYTQTIESVQPQGPYFLIGYSLGGLIMMEIAQRVFSRGQKIGLLAMIDSYPYRSYLSLDQQFPLAVRAVVRRIYSLRKLLRRPNQQPPLSSTGELHARIYSGAMTAWKRYRPRSYSGKINFLRAETVSYFPKNVRAVWGHLVEVLEVRTLPGDHGALVNRHSKEVTDVLTTLLPDTFLQNRVDLS